MRKIFPLIVATCIVTGDVSGAELTLQLSGTSFEGPPSFDVLVDGKVVGQGALEADASLTTFTFDVSDSQLVPGAIVAVALTNDLYAGEGRDRNLFVHGVSVGATTFDPTDIVISRLGKQARKGTGSYAAIVSGTELASVTLPSPSESAVPPGEVDTPELDMTAEAVTPDLLPCDLSVTLSGFGNNMLELSDEQVAQLDVLQEDLSRPHCELVVTGYGSISGEPAVNDRISQARADIVASYLADKGISFRAVSRIGAGGSSAFGPREADNRVVVIELR